MVGYDSDDFISSPASRVLKSFLSLYLRSLLSSLPGESRGFEWLAEALKLGYSLESINTRVIIANRFYLLEL